MRRLALLLSLLPLAGKAPAQPPPLLSSVQLPKLESATTQLEAATRLRSSLRGASGALRADLVRDTLAAYRAVRLHWPQAPLACAEAAFRAGELLRVEGDEAGALAEFEWLRAAKSVGPWRARAGLEIAHIHRRAGRNQPALEAYLAVNDDPRSEPIRRDDAALWAGRTCALLGKLDEARRRWECDARRAEDPLQRIEAWDELAQAAIDEADLEGAAGWIGRARESMADAALEETEHGERVRSALEHMRALRRLERAVAQRVRNGQRDAQR